MKLLIQKDLLIKPDKCDKDYWQRVVACFKGLDKDYCLLVQVADVCITVREQKCRLSERDMGNLLFALESTKYDTGFLKCTDYTKEFFVDAGQLVLVIE